MNDLLIILILLFVIGIPVAYVMQSRKKGITCIGCGHSKTCGSHSDCDCNPLYKAYYGK